jgi:predicted site-specific integrase-resolvase
MVLTDDSGLYDMRSLANHLKVSRHLVRKWRDDGKIPAPLIRDGKRCYWSVEQIDEWKSMSICVAHACKPSDKPN